MKILPPRQMLDPMGRFELAVGMRLHFLIFAAPRGTPFTALQYASKVSVLLQHLQIETPPMARIGIGQLVARIDRAGDLREETRAKIRARVPELTRRDRQTNELIVRLLSERTLELREPSAPSHH